MSLPTIVDSNEKLRKIFPILKSATELALDTEFIWERTYYPILGIVQIGLANGDSTIIDIIAVDDLTPLADIISDPKITKVLHDATQDLTILHNACGALPKNVFDTQKASAFSGLGASISLANLLAKTVNIDLAKTETRTNWLKRPLSKKQIDYALDDVRYLCKAKDIMLEKIKDKPTINWLNEEMETLNTSELYLEKESSISYMRIKGRKRLRYNELTLLQILAEWREDKARMLNIPREHVIADKQLISICKTKPINEKTLKNNKKITDQKLFTNLEEILRLCNSTQKPSIEIAKNKDSGRRAGEKISAITDLAISIVKAKSLQYHIDPSIAYSRSAIEAMVKDPANNPPSGWRAQFIGNDIIELIKGNRTVTINKKTGLPGI